MANTAFQWAWNDYPPQSDPGMTRTRAASLLHAWRATSRKPRASWFVMRTLERIGPGRYRVTDNASGERGTLIVLRQ
jgi:predicted transcriptional regulator of viral defense system